MKTNTAEKTGNKIHALYKFIFPVILFVYPLLKINQGVDITDTGYSLGNFRFADSLTDMWMFSTYLANVTGTAFMKLPFGHTMLGMNFYAGLFVSITAVISYLFFVKVFAAYLFEKGLQKSPGPKTDSRAWDTKAPLIFFLGIFVAVSLCWCPTVTLYNYMTYFFFTIGSILLYLGLINGKSIYFLLAGIALGMNVMVRFPNAAEASLILIVWYCGWFYQEKSGSIWKNTGFCILGYLIGLLGILGGIIANHGLDAYMRGIGSMFAMSGSASDYTITAMLRMVFLIYVESSKWVILLGIFLLAGMAVFYLLENRLEKPWMLIIKGLYLGGFLVLLRFFYGRGMFNIKYYTYESMFWWLAAGLLITLLGCLTVLLGKMIRRIKQGGGKIYTGASGGEAEAVLQQEKKEHILLMLLLAIILVTPLGSNNHIYPLINNLFLAAPAVLYLLYQHKEKILCRTKSFRFPLQVVTLGILAVIGIQSFGFGICFVFRDGMDGQKRDTKVTESDILQGMYTNAGHAAALDELCAFAKAEDMASKEVLLYGQIPAVSYILDMPTAISTSWPDLNSYEVSVMEEEMKALQGEEGHPYIILSSRIQAFYTQNAELLTMLEVTEEAQESLRKDIKLKMILEFLEALEYRCIFENEEFAIYE